MTIFLDLVNCGKVRFPVIKKTNKKINLPSRAAVSTECKTFFYPFMTTTNLFASLLVLETIFVCERPDSANLWDQHLAHFPSLFVMILIQMLAILSSTKLSGSCHVQGIISQVSHQEWVLNCVCVASSK